MQHGLQPYRALLDSLRYRPDESASKATLGWIDRANVHALEHRVRSATGAPIRFVAAGSVRVHARGKQVNSGERALEYERRVHDDGIVPCRPGGAGAAHDLHNALVWLRFPVVKATLNRLHLQPLRAQPLLLQSLHPHRQSRRPPLDNRTVASANASTSIRRDDLDMTQGRGSLRDALTLLDESGLAWFGDHGLLDDLLAKRQWTELLWTHREKVVASVAAIVIGHGLLEKLHRPYKSMTANCLACRIDDRPFEAGTSDLEHQNDDPDPLDAAIAVRLMNLAAADDLSPSRLMPLPVQGLPGWDPANDDPSYYADRQVFRALRAAPDRRSTRGD